MTDTEGKATCTEVPWVASTRNSIFHSTVRTERGFTVAVVHGGDLAARKMAAAPALEKALRGLLETYTQLVNCGDCGTWDPEQEAEVQAAREALRLAGPSQ